jgi:hypothetical protein
MVLLILLGGFSLATAMIVESRLSLNTILERVVMIFSLVASQWFTAIQVLSLATDLNSRGLILAAIVSFSLALCLLQCRRRPANRLPWKELLGDARSHLAESKSARFVSTLFGVAAVIIGLNAMAGALMIPHIDAYHFEKPLFWRQNQSIEPFVTDDPLITCTAFAGEALGLPGYVFCRSGTRWLGGVSLAGILWLAGILALSIVYAIARRLGCSPRASMVAAMLPLGVPNWYDTFFFSHAALILAGLWVGASVLFLMRCGGAVELSGEFLTRLGCSIFCFILGCGAKNTTIFLTPVFLLGLAMCLRRLLFEVKVMQVLAGWAMAALLCSGVLWNYAWNFKWCGNISGPRYMQGTLSPDRSVLSAWTRCCRGAVLFLLDVTWLPGSGQEPYKAVCHKAVRLLGGRNELAEDDKGFYNFQDLQPGVGIGLLGPLAVLPAFIYGTLRLLRGGYKTNLEDKLAGNMDLLLLFLFCTGYWFLCHVFLRSQSLGLWRLMPAFPILAAPVCGLLLEKRWPRMALLSLAGLCLLVPSYRDLIVMGNRFAANKRVSKLEGSGLVQKFFPKIGKHQSWEVECQWENEAPQKAIIYEPFSSREIALMFLQKARHPAVVGFAGGVFSDAYYFFGPDLSNRIVPLVDFRQPEQLLEPPAQADYLVFAQNFAANFGQKAGIEPVKQNLWAMRHGYRPFLQVNREGDCVFLSFEKNPNPASGLSPRD